MIHPKDRAEKIRQAPSNSGRWIKKMPQEKKEEHLAHALHHDNDAGMSSTDEFVYLRKQETEGR